MQQLAKALDSPPRASLLLFAEKAIALYAAAFVGTQSRCEGRRHGDGGHLINGRAGMI